MPNETGLSERLKKMSTENISLLCRTVGVHDFADLSLEDAKKVVLQFREGCVTGKEEYTVVGFISTLRGGKSVEDGDIEELHKFLTEYLADITWTQSQIEANGGERRKAFLLSHLIYKYVANKRVLAIPVTLNQLVRELHANHQLEGINGLIIRNLSPGNEYQGDYLEALDTEMMRLNFYKTKAEGKEFLGKSLKSKQHYIRFAKSYTHDTVDRGDVLHEDMIYIAYLTQTIAFRNTSILADKTRVFFGVLREPDLELSKKIQTNPIFQKTRIYEEDGYTLILRGRFVLIDSIRNQVIINKTPTDMAKKDIELMVRLLTTK